MKTLRRNKKQKKVVTPWSSYLSLVIPMFLLLGGIGLFFYEAVSEDEIKERQNLDAETWQRSYWKKPIPLQGPAPEEHHLLAKTLHPEDCAKCHVEQYKTWSESLHAHAMGPGLTGQYVQYSHRQKGQCNDCHAPMSEQWEALKQSDGSWKENEHYDAKLASKGITCAACHLRAHKRHAPPLRSGASEVSAAIHGEPHRTAFFESSEFCKGCHQHTSGAKPGGKFIENTYNEWLVSPAFEEGKSCQSCHMPDRQHLWKGIHDPKTTKDGVEIRYEVSEKSPKVGDSLEAILAIKSVGVGHSFPTYNTPAVFVKMAFLDKDKKAMKGFYEEKIIQRRLTGKLKEVFDTRLNPGEEAILEFERKIPKEARYFKAWIWVEPDHFYEGFYRTFLKNGVPPDAQVLLEQALEQTLKNQYALFSQLTPISQ